VEGAPRCGRGTQSDAGHEACVGHGGRRTQSGAGHGAGRETQSEDTK
jgi:hypothetical protein